MNLEEIIEVPEHDIKYHAKFDKRCYELVEDYQELKNRK